MKRNRSCFPSRSFILGAVLLSFMAIYSVSRAESSPSTISSAPPSGYLFVPGYGPGIAGHVMLFPLVAVCYPPIPAGVICIGPYVDAIVKVLDATGAEVGNTRTNSLGAFVVSVPPGPYIVHIQTVDFPFCAETKVIVGQELFSLMSVTCSTGIP